MALALAIAFTVDARAGTRTDLTGHVLDDKGAPLRGATVLIERARPRVGVGTLCPTCYPDCVKSTISDAQGAFTLGAVDDSLEFRVLALANGRDPRLVAVDPRLGPIIIRMNPRDTTALDPRRTSRGVVMGTDGRPTVGALVEELGLTHGPPGLYEPVHGAPPIAICDQDGRFAIPMPDTAAIPALLILARDHAPRFVADLPRPPAIGRIDLSRGTGITGVVTREHQPVPGAVVSIRADGEPMMDGPEIRTDSIATDALGRYRFQNLACHHSYRLRVTFGSIPDGGVTRHVSVTVGGSDSVVTAPPLVVVPGRRLSGHVRLSDGHTLPFEPRLSVQSGGERRIVPIAADGHFEVSGIPPEEITVSVGFPGYHLSSRMSPDIPRRGPLFALGMTRDREIEIVLEPEPTTTPAPEAGR